MTRGCLSLPNLDDYDPCPFHADWSATALASGLCTWERWETRDSLSCERLLHQCHFW